EVDVTVTVTYTGVPDGEELTVEVLNGTPLNGNIMSEVISTTAANVDDVRTVEFTFRMLSDSTTVDFLASFAPSACSGDSEPGMVTLPNDCCPTVDTFAVCSTGENNIELTAPGNLTGVVWINEVGDTVAMGNPAMIDATTAGLEDGIEAFIYRGFDVDDNNCPIELCCPFFVEICTLEIDLAPGGAICNTQVIDLTTGFTVNPMDIMATWTTSGDGTFDDGAGIFGTAATYTPGPGDIANGGFTLALTADTTGDQEGCCPVFDTVTYELLKVDCGTFPWNGND
ncbi:MAG: hypothetical protein AAFQ37_03565, partial [Bacteroidota bacterium]